MADLVIPDPDCTTIPMKETYEFFVLASDGLWDVVNDAEAISIARYVLFGKSMKFPKVRNDLF